MIFKNLLWDYFGKFSAALMQILTSFVLMRILNVSEFGLIGITLAINGIASSFANFGFASYIIQQKDEDSELQSTIFWFNVFLGGFLASMLIIFSGFIANFYKLPELKNTAIVCSFFIPITLINSVPNALLGKRLQFKQINLRNIIVAIGCAIIGIVAALLGFGVWALVLQQGLNLVLNLIVSFRLIKWVPSFEFSKSKFRGAFNFGKYIFLATLIESIYSKLDVFTIGKIYNLDSVGYYTRAQGLSGNVIQLSSKSLLNVLFPVLTRVKDDKKELIRNYYTYFHHICFAFCILSTFSFLFAQPAFITFFKPKWAYAAVLFKIIILSSVVLPLSELMLAIIEARGNSKNYFIADIWKKVLLYPTYLVLFFFNIEGYLYTTFFGLLGALMINLYFLNKEIEIGYSRSCKIFLTYFLPTLTIAFLLDKFLPTENDWIFAVGKFLFSIIVLFITLYFIPSPTYQLIIQKLRK